MSVTRRGFLGALALLITARKWEWPQTDTYHVHFTHHETVWRYRHVQNIRDLLNQENDILNDLPWKEVP
jgi:hypothetical protein